MANARSHSSDSRGGGGGGGGGGGRGSGDERPGDDDDAPITINKHDDLRRNMRRICQRLNRHPEIARLIFVNAVLALEDVNVKLSSDVQDHIIKSLRFPPKLVERRERLEAELRPACAELGVDFDDHADPTWRARLLFDVLKLQPHDPQDQAHLPSNRLEHYASSHRLAAKLAEYDRVRRGGFLFHPRETYEAYKAGAKQHRWIRAVRFNV